MIVCVNKKESIYTNQTNKGGLRDEQNLQGYLE